MAKVVLNKLTCTLNDLNADCCTWLIEHAHESNDSSFIELVSNITKLPWDCQTAMLIRYFESKREHPLLIKCIETVSHNWPFYIEEYDENLFRYSIEQKRKYVNAYDVTLVEESLKLIPIVHKGEVIDLMKKQDFSGLVAYLKARDIAFVIE